MKVFFAVWYGFLWQDVVKVKTRIQLIFIEIKHLAHVAKHFSQLFHFTGNFYILGLKAFWSGKTERLKSRALYQTKLFCWVFSWQQCQTFAQLGFPAWDGTAALGRGVTHCAHPWGFAISAWRGVTLSARFSHNHESFLSSFSLPERPRCFFMCRL